MLSRRTQFRLMSFYPPYLGAGIRVAAVSPDLLTVDVRMRLRWWNRNVVGTHFGGSLYAMCDPFFMLILLEQLGREYVIWDKAATVRFKRPGRGPVTARFQVTPAQVLAIRAEIDQIGRKDYTFYTRVLGADGEVVAEVDKLVYVRRKDFVFKPPTPSRPSRTPRGL